MILDKDYPFTFDVSVWHVTAETPSIFGAELVWVHFGCPAGRRDVPQHLGGELFLWDFLGQYFCFSCEAFV
jgi:hypothetical protein